MAQKYYFRQRMKIDDFIDEANGSIDAHGYAYVLVNNLEDFKDFTKEQKETAMKVVEALLEYFPDNAYVIKEDFEEEVLDYVRY